MRVVCLSLRATGPQMERGSPCGARVCRVWSDVRAGASCDRGREGRRSGPRARVLYQQQARSPSGKDERTCQRGRETGSQPSRPAMRKTKRACNYLLPPCADGRSRAHGARALPFASCCRDIPLQRTCRRHHARTAAKICEAAELSWQKKAEMNVAETQVDVVASAWKNAEAGYDELSGAASLRPARTRPSS